MAAAGKPDCSRKTLPSPTGDRRRRTSAHGRLVTATTASRQAAKAPGHDAAGGGRYAETAL